MISLNKFTEICKVLPPKICALKETKDINVKGFNMITNKEDAKAITEHISFDCKCKFNSTTCEAKLEWNNKTCKCEWKNFPKYEKDYSWNPSKFICQKSQHLKNAADTSVTKCDDIVIVMNNLSSTASMNCHCKKVRHWYILHTLLLAIMLKLILTIIWYHYAKQRVIV